MVSIAEVLALALTPPAAQKPVLAAAVTFKNLRRLCLCVILIAPGFRGFAIYRAAPPRENVLK